MNIFADYFNAAELTAAINAAPFTPGILSAAKLFGESGVKTTRVIIEQENGSLSIVPAAPRGAPPQTRKPATSNLVELDLVHLPVRASVMAHQVQDQRAVGTVDLETVERVQKRTVAGMRGDLELTLEYHRFGALAGKILDYDGSTLLDVYAAFGVTQQSVPFNIASATSAIKVLNKVIEAERKSVDALTGANASGFTAYCSRAFVDNLRNHDSFYKLLEILQLDEARTGELFKLSRTTFVEVPDAGEIEFVAEGEAILVPQGIKDLCISRFGPGDYVDEVNQTGLPISVKTEPMPFNRGIALEAQMNAISVPTRPAAIIRLTSEAS